MLFKEPNTFKKLSEETSLQEYNFKEVEGLGVALLVSTGGREVFGPEKNERVLIIDEGRAFIEIGGKGLDLRDGDVIEIPVGMEAEINGFYKGKLISAR